MSGIQIYILACVLCGGRAIVLVYRMERAQKREERAQKHAHCLAETERLERELGISEPPCSVLPSGRSALVLPSGRVVIRSPSESLGISRGWRS